MRALLYPNAAKDGGYQVTRQVVKQLSAAGIASVGIAECWETPVKGVQLLPQKQAVEACDLAISIGGDGTLLHAAAVLFGTEKPVLGLNLGSFGFLALLDPADLQQLHKLQTGDYYLSVRSLLDVYVNGEKADTALNEVLLSKGSLANTVTATVSVDGAPVFAHTADGVLFATPTGSTAYSLSAGGPLCDPESPVLLLTPVCAHSLNSPPIVFPDHRVFEVQIEKTHRGDDHLLVIDGRRTLPVQPKDRIVVKKSPFSARLITFDPQAYLRRIDEKLKGR